MHELGLADAGLSKRESAVYLALLELGSVTVGSLVQKSGVPSSKIYEILEQLIEMGFVSYVVIKQQKHFQAADPQRLLDVLEEKRNHLSRILPALQAKQRLAKDRQSVELYEGKSAIFSVLRSLLRDANKGELYSSISVGNEHEDDEVARFYRQFTLLRAEIGLDVRVLTSESYRSVFQRTYSVDLLRSIKNRFTSFHFPQGFVIFRDKTIFLNWGERPTAVVLTSQQLASNYSQFFLELYAKAKS